MANTGIVWGAWTAVTKSGTGDWTALAVADNGNAGSAEIAFGTKVAIKVGYSFVEDNTGAIDGVVTIYVLGETADGDWQIYAVDSPYNFQVTPTQNATIRDWFTLYAGSWGDSIKIWILNESGQELATTFKYQTGDVPVASA